MSVLRKRLISLNKSHNQVDNHGLALQQAITHLKSSTKLKFLMKDPVISQLVEKTADFRISSSNMMDTSSRFVTFAVNQESGWEESQEKKEKLDEQIEKLTKQQLTLVMAHDKMKRDLTEMSSYMSKFMSSYLKVSQYIPEISSLIENESDSDDFHDAQDDFVDHSHERALFHNEPENTANGFVKTGLKSETLPLVSETHIEVKHIEKTVSRKRRTRIPDKPADSSNLWEIMKNCIGRDLSRIPMPVNFNEPISFLQRLTEGLEYSELLTRAADSSTVEEALSYLAALAVSTYSTSAARTSKPFNPLLGETFECDRSDDLGWRSVTEQVSHHPPVAAIHVEHEKWTYYFDFSMRTKFRGKYLQVFPQGYSHFVVKRTGHHYTWNKVSTTVQNIIVGKLWVDLSGEIELQEHTTGAKGSVRFYPYSYFSRRQHRQVTGKIVSADGRVKYDIQGNWNISVSCAEVAQDDTTVEGGVVNSSGVNSVDHLLSEHQVRWLKNPPLEDCEKIYNFTELSCSLNEPEEGVAPTDSRNRPDQRLMENQDFPGANAMKLKLEHAQRVRRAQRNADNVTHNPKWFEKQTCELVGDEVWVFKGEYWECKERQDWTRCPVLFLEDEESDGDGRAN